LRRAAGPAEASGCYERRFKRLAGLIPMSMRRCEALLDVIGSCGAIGEPQQVFQMIEEDLRANWLRQSNRNL
jgi:hypothetical protein